MANSPPQQSRSSTTSRYLRPADLRRLRNVTFESRRHVEGQLAGRHRSRQRGQSIEFNDYRQYIPGDPVGDIDWKVYGRSDKLFIKLYEHESDLCVNLLVDASASMNYGEAGATKYDHAARLAASIAFLITQQRDRISLAVAHQGLPQPPLPASSPRKMAGLLERLETTTPAGDAQLAIAVRDLGRIAPRRSVLILISDLLEDRDAIMRECAIWAARSCEVILFHVLHAHELDLPDVSSALFIDAETEGRMRVQVDDIREAYAERMRTFLADWSRSCRARGFDYNRVSTDDQPHGALERYLFRRSARQM
ncbi:MAG: DUF58 domain-containing protein [Phycisphaerales bacterium]